MSDNSLREYIVKNGLASIDIHAMTGIPTSDISSYKNGRTVPIPAERVYLISLMSKEPLEEFLLKIYPKITLQNKSRPPVKTLSHLKTPFGVLINSLDDLSLNTISFKTGITVKRLKDLSSKPTSVLWGHELLLIEFATNVKPGVYFKKLFGDLKLNNLDLQMQLREAEKKKSRRSKKEE